MRCFCVAAAFAFEQMATLALAVNLVIYFNTVMHYSISDAANHLTNFMGTSYILSIVVAYLTDGYLGRFKAVILSLSIEFLVYMQFIIRLHYMLQVYAQLCLLFAVQVSRRVIEILWGFDVGNWNANLASCLPKTPTTYM